METQYRYLYIADHIMVLLQIYIVVMERLDNLVIGEVLKWWEKKRGKNWLLLMVGGGGSRNWDCNQILIYSQTLNTIVPFT